MPDQTYRPDQACREALEFGARFAHSAEALGSISDEDVDVGATPKTEIMRVEKVTLSRYTPLKGVEVKTGPVLIVYGLVGRYTMADLREERSLVRNLPDVEKSVGDVGIVHVGVEVDRRDRDTDLLTDPIDAVVEEPVRLVKGTFELGGEVVDLQRLAMPVPNVYALQDHIIPPPCAKGLGPLIGTDDYTELSLPGGHVGVYVSSKSQGIVGDTVFDWLIERQ